MKIIDVQAKDIFVTFEMSRKQIRYLLKVVELALPIEYNTETDPEAEAACKYFENEFVPGLEGQKMRDYHVVARVTDRQMKPQELAFTDTKERVHWDETIEADGFESETAVELAVLMQLAKTWSPKKYDIEVTSITEKLVQKTRLILPE